MPGDKFANMMKAQAATAPAGRGKFGKNLGGGGGMGVKVPSQSSSTTADASSDANLVQKRQRRKRQIKERQLQLLEDLDQAEELTLQLLQLAASTTQELADATLEGDEEKWKTCQKNGVEYMQKVKQIHTLLSPHAHYVVAYKNHAVDEGTLESEPSHSDEASTAKNSTSIKRSASNESAIGGTAKKMKKSQGEQSNDTEDIAGASTKMKVGQAGNMYAARVEKRLAIERRNILREMLRLEKHEAKRQN